MPFQIGSVAVHDDGQHFGSSKRDAAGGVAGLDAGGNLLAKGSVVWLANDAGYVHIKERTFSETVMQAQRHGVEDYTLYLAVGGAANKIIQHSDMKDVFSGIAALGAGGQLLAPGPDIELTRDGSENIEVVERTSGDIVYRWTRIGANDYECRINCGGVACIIQNDSMKDIAGGIAGLDANVQLDVLQMRPCVEEYSNHLGVIDDFITANVAGNGVVAADAANHEIDVTTGANAIGHGTIHTKKTYTLGTKPLVCNMLVQNLVTGTSNVNTKTMLGLMSMVTGVGTNHSAVFHQDSAGDWFTLTCAAACTSNGIADVTNGDLLTIVATSSAVLFFVNGTLVQTHTTNLPTAGAYYGAKVGTLVNTNAVGRSCSVDLMGVKKWY